MLLGLVMKFDSMSSTSLLVRGGLLSVGVVEADELLVAV